MKLRYGRAMLDIEEEDLPADAALQPRPATRAECVYGERPCPHVSCRFHLLLDVYPTGSLVLNWNPEDIDTMPETCVLDVAALGGATLEETGKVMHLTRERVRQIEAMALKKCKMKPSLRGRLQVFVHD